MRILSWRLWLGAFADIASQVSSLQICFSVSTAKSNWKSVVESNSLRIVGIDRFGVNRLITNLAGPVVSMENFKWLYNFNFRDLVESFNSFPCRISCLDCPLTSHA